MHGSILGMSLSLPMMIPTNAFSSAIKIASSTRERFFSLKYNV